MGGRIKHVSELTPEELIIRREKARINFRKFKEKSIAYKIWVEKNKETLNKRSLDWQKNNVEKTKEIRKKWTQSEKGKIKCKEVNAKWREIHREEHLKRRRENQKRLYYENPLLKFSANTRSLIYHSFKRGSMSFKKKMHTEEILGCSIDFFCGYILSLCPKGATFKDFGRFGYHIDHIIPISIAKTEEEVIKLCHYTNLQPLWWKENLTKSNKIDYNL